MSRLVEASEVRRFPVDLRAEGRTITGLAAPYAVANDVGPFVETLQPGVFAKSIAESARALPLFANHDHEAIPVGKASRWTEAADGLYGEWLMDTRAEAREIVRLVNEDLLGGMSVGFLPIRSDWDHSGDDKPRVVRHEARLLETSLVAVPAHSTARVLAVRSAGEPDDPGSRVIPTPRLTEFKAWLASVR